MRLTDDHQEQTPDRPGHHQDIAGQDVGRGEWVPRPGSARCDKAWVQQIVVLARFHPRSRSQIVELLARVAGAAMISLAGDAATLSITGQPADVTQAKRLLASSPEVEQVVRLFTIGATIADPCHAR